MSGQRIDAVLPGELTEAHAKFREMRDEAAWERGHSGYSGSWNTLSGLRVVNVPTFTSRDEAFRYVMDRAEKRGDALAVRFRAVKRVARKEPTFGGKVDCLRVRGSLLDPFAFVATRHEQRNDSWVIVVIPADQLTPAQQEEAREVGRTYWNADLALRQVADAQVAACRKLNPYEQKDTAAWTALKPDWATLKKLHADVVKAVRAAQKAKAAMDKLNTKLSPGLLVEEDVDEGERWLIAGIAAS